jgi:hypothetical protein
LHRLDDWDGRASGEKSPNFPADGCFPFLGPTLAQGPAQRRNVRRFLFRRFAPPVFPPGEIIFSVRRAR